MKSFIRIDKNGRVIPGSNINRKTQPKIGKWKEIFSTLCCHDILLEIYGSAKIISGDGCESSSLDFLYYFNGIGPYPEIGDKMFINSLGTIFLADGTYAWDQESYQYWGVVENGIIITKGDCGR